MYSNNEIVPSLEKRKAYLFWTSKRTMSLIWVAMGVVFILAGLIAAVANWGKEIPSGSVDGVPSGEYMNAGYIGLAMAAMGFVPILIGLALVPLFFKIFTVGEQKYIVSDIKIPKADILKTAPLELNAPGSKVHVDIVGDWIDVTINWQDSLSFAPLGVHKFQYIFKKMVLVGDDYTYRELDFEDLVDIDTRVWSFSYYKKFRCGRIAYKRVEYSFGVDNNTGNIGLNKYSLSTGDISDIIHKWLAERGYSRKD